MFLNWCSLLPPHVCWCTHTMVATLPAAGSTLSEKTFKVGSMRKKIIRMHLNIFSHRQVKVETFHWISGKEIKHSGPWGSGRNAMIIHPITCRREADATYLPVDAKESRKVACCCYIAKTCLTFLLTVVFHIKCNKTTATDTVVDGVVTKPSHLSI